MSSDLPDAPSLASSDVDIAFWLEVLVDEIYCATRCECRYCARLRRDGVAWW